MQVADFPIEKLIEYASNPRVNDHVVEQIAAAIKAFGFRVPILAKSDGNIIDGHLRLKAARRLGMETVPVLFADDMSDIQIKAFRLSVNKMAELADWDEELLKIELAELSDSDFDLSLIGFDDFDFSIDKNDPETIEDVSPDLPGATALKADMAFPSKLPWNIPELRLDMMAEIPPNLKTWAGRDATPDDGESWYMWNWRTDSLRESPKDRLMIGFYTDDYRFECMWQEPSVYVSKILNLGVRLCLTPNYSLWMDSPKAVQLWATYRSRWVGRYMQEAGILIIPDVNFSDAKSFEFCLLGIPKNCPALSVQLQTGRSKEETKGAIYGLQRALNELTPKSLMVYGHKKASEVMQKVGYDGVVHYLGNRTEYRREVINNQ